MHQMKIKNAILPGRGSRSRWDVDLVHNTITAIKPSTSASASPSTPASHNSHDPSPLLLPPLCHPHIHLDKAYLLTCNSQRLSSPSHPDYSDLTPKDGSFGEALKFTALAKERYTAEDLYLRGAQLLATSLAQGVTSCRAFVEVDHVTGQLCLQAAVALEECFRGKLKVQICTFAQDPIFSTEHGEENRRVLTDALKECGGGGAGVVEVLGTTPYVEKTAEASLRNIEWAIETALENNLHLDFHLDYNLDDDDDGGGQKKPMVWEVVRLLKELKWNERAEKGKTIVLGHCTRLTLCSDAEMAALAKEIKDSNLAIHFVGLPTSDLFMMGRPSSPSSSSKETKSAHRPRGTLQVLDMIRRLNMDACLSVNNVGNAFTPWGTGDPLSLASLAVGLYQAGTEEDAEVLFECVSSRARRAIGLDNASALDPSLPLPTTNIYDGLATAGDRGEEGGGDMTELHTGRKGELLLIQNKEYVGCPGHLGVKIPARQRVSVRDVVWDPPEDKLRQVVRCL